MKFNTPPSSPYFPENNDDINEDEDEGEMILIGDAQELSENLDIMSDNGDDDDDQTNENISSMNMEMIDEEGESSTQPIRDDGSITFSKHNKPVFSGSLHPSQKLAVTGGEDDRAYVWSTDTGDVIHQIDQHKDTVIAAVFSSDGNYLATGDMLGDIYVYKLSQNFNKIWETSIGDMSWMKWHMASNVLIAGTDNGEVYIWRIPHGDCKVLSGNAIKTDVGCLTADGKRLIVGYNDGCIKLWDIKTSQIIKEISPEQPMAHTDAVLCIAADPDNGIFLSGGEDGKIVIGGPNGALGNLFPNDGSIESIVFGIVSENKLAVSGTINGNITIWDISRQAIRISCQNPNEFSISKIIWINETLLCGTINGSVLTYDARSGRMKNTLEGHTATIYELNYHKNRNMLLTMSEDGTAKIFTSLNL